MFYNQLLELCDEKGVKLTPLLNSLNMSKGNIEKWRKGVLPNGETLLKLAKYFDVSTDYLLTGKKNIHEKEYASMEFERLLEFKMVKEGLTAFFKSKPKPSCDRTYLEYKDSSEEKYINELVKKSKIPKDRIIQLIKLTEGCYDRFEHYDNLEHYDKKKVAEVEKLYPYADEFQRMLYVNPCDDEAVKSLMDSLNSELDILDKQKKRLEIVSFFEKEIQENQNPLDMSESS